MSTYGSRFKEAVDRAAALGFPRENINSESVLLTESHGHQLVELAARELAGAGELTREALAFRCGQVSVAMARHVEAVSGLKPVLTLGTVSKNGADYWDFDVENPQVSIAAGAFHVWLTTPGMEVVDFTLLVSIQVQQGLAQQAGPLAGNPDQIWPYRWRPMIAGNDTVRNLLRVEP